MLLTYPLFLTYFVNMFCNISSDLWIQGIVNASWVLNVCHFLFTLIFPHQSGILLGNSESIFQKYMHCSKCWDIAFISIFPFSFWALCAYCLSSTTNTFFYGYSIQVCCFILMISRGIVWFCLLAMGFAMTVCFKNCYVQLSRLSNFRLL